MKRLTERLSDSDIDYRLKIFQNERRRLVNADKQASNEHRTLKEWIAKLRATRLN